MFLLKSLIGIRGHNAAYGGSLRGLSGGQRWLWPLLLEGLENQICLSTRTECVSKRHLVLATLLGIVMTAFVPYAYADLYVSSRDSNSVLRYNEVTGDFIDEFVSAGSGLNSPRGLLLGPDGNLYVP